MAIRDASQALFIRGGRFRRDIEISVGTVMRHDMFMPWQASLERLSRIEGADELSAARESAVEGPSHAASLALCWACPASSYVRTLLDDARQSERCYLLVARTEGNGMIDVH